MSLFQRALRNVKQIEGGFTDDPRDPGGATKHGISLRFAQQLAGQSRAWRANLDLNGDGQINADDIQRITPQLAARIYETEFWDRYKCGAMPAPVGVMMFSFYVNMRPATATQILQRAINRAGGRCTVDGIAGPQTMDEIAQVRPARTVQAHRRRSLDVLRQPRRASSPLRGRMAVPQRRCALGSRQRLPRSPALQLTNRGRPGRHPERPHN